MTPQDGKAIAALKQELLRGHLIQRADWDAAFAEAGERGMTPWELLVERGVPERELYQRLAAALSVRLWEAGELFGRADLNVSRTVPRRYQERKRLIPLRRVEGALEIASCDPQPRTIDLVDAFGADRVQLCLVTPTDFRRLRWAVDLGQVSGELPSIPRGLKGDLLASSGWNRATCRCCTPSWRMPSGSEQAMFTWSDMRGGYACAYGSTGISTTSITTG